MESVSLSLDEVKAIKRRATYDAHYDERVSLGFAFSLACLGAERGEHHHVLHEINVLEGLASNSSTKEPAQFRRPPLHPLWHKHFSTSGHLTRNMGERWGLGGAGNRDFSAVVERAAVEYGSQPELWQKWLTYQVWMVGIDDRATSRRMTGDWIIFAKHEGQNFYIGLATHDEGHRDPDALYQKLRGGSEFEFPFLFT